MMLRTTRIAIAMLLTIAGSLSAQRAEPQPISLAEAVRMARRNAPAAVQALGAVRTSRAAVVGSIAQFIPSLGVNAGVRKSSGATFFQGQLVPFQGDAWSQNRGYGATLTLFDGGQRWFSYRAAQLSLDASRATEVSQSYAVALSVKQQYYAVLSAREAQAAAERQLEQAQRQLQLAAVRMQAGAVPRTDSLRSAILVGNARIAILNARTALEDGNAALTRVIGSPTDVTAIASDTAALPTVSLSREALEGMAADGPAVQAAMAQLAAARNSRRSTWTTYLPTVSANYGFGTSRSSPEFAWGDGPGSRNTSLGFSANYTIFGGYQREQQVVQASVAEDNAEAALRDARAAAKQGLAQSLNALSSAAEAIALQQLQVAVAEEDLDVQQQRYAAGASSLVDLLTAQTTLATARSALIAARAQARTAKAQLEALVGRDLP